MNFERFPLPAGQSLAQAYIERSDQAVEALYGFHPSEPVHWRRRAAMLDSQTERRADARLIAEVLLDFNRKFGVSKETFNHIEALRRGAPAVVGGQQAGLLTGPLMVLHKAVSVIQTARYAGQLLGRPVVPVFWIAGEDHDWDEASHTYLISSEPSLRKMALPRPAGTRTSISRTVLSPSVWETALRELASLLPDTAYKPELMETIRTITGRSGTLTEQFAGLLGWLFGSEGLVLIDADDPALRRLESPMFHRMITENEALESAYAQAAAAVQSMGYDAQAEVLRDCANLFLFDRPDKRGGEHTPQAAGDRILLYKNGDTYVDRKGFLQISKQQLLDISQSEPERLSNNVLTRPIMQDYVLPVLAAVLGPAEIAYWGLTGNAFRLFGMEMPIVVPRMSFTLLDRTTQKQMIKYSLSPDDIVHRFEERRSAWLSGQDELSADRRFDAVLGEMMAVYDPLLRQVVDAKPGLRAIAEKNRSKIVEQIEFMRLRVLEDERRKHDAALRHWSRVRLGLWPDGKPQERVINFTFYWNLYGPDWLSRLLDTPVELNGSHRILYL